ncbi:4-coumarate--CoA ligase-like 9-like protein [Drosera capensis]
MARKNSITYPPTNPSLSTSPFNSRERPPHTPTPMPPPPSSTTTTVIDPVTGYCPSTRTFHSTRPAPPLPPPHLPLSVHRHVISLLHQSLSSTSSSTSSTVFLIDSLTGASLSYSAFLSQINSLTHQLSLLPIRKGHVALILSPPSFSVPVLYFSLLSLGVVVSPANPLSTQTELTHLVRLAKPAIAFVVSDDVAAKLPTETGTIPLGVVRIDSPEFESWMTGTESEEEEVRVKQSDSAMILYSSGTTGRVKGVESTHRSYIVMVSSLHHNKFAYSDLSRVVSLFTLPLFHVFGFFMLLKSVALAETLVLVRGRFDFEGMLRTVERFRVTYMPVSPPVVVAMVKSELTERFDLRSLESVACGGAPLGRNVARRFREKFPNVLLIQGYGMTETVGGAATMKEPEETERYASVGRLSQLMEAKIVDPETGKALPPGQRGELWVRGPLVMKGYVGDKDATAATLDAEGWLKTGDLCYFDSDGFLYIVDRLKELIKYKAYQVPPAELERLLLSHPEIADAAVVPYPDEEAGQIPMAYVVKKAGSSITGDHIMDFVAKQACFLFCVTLKLNFMMMIMIMIPRFSGSLHASFSTHIQFNRKKSSIGRRV